MNPVPGRICLFTSSSLGICAVHPSPISATAINSAHRNPLIFCPPDQIISPSALFTLPQFIARRYWLVSICFTSRLSHRPVLFRHPLKQVLPIRPLPHIMPKSGHLRQLRLSPGRVDLLHHPLAVITSHER